MALDSRYIQAFTIEDVLLDKDTGAPLSGGKVYFYEDLQRTVLKAVYELTGTAPNYTYTQMANPVILSSIGTFEDTMGNPKIPYFFPYDADGNIERYYIAVYSSTDVFQFAREAQPYIFGTVIPPDQIINGENLLANPQFVQVSFNPQAPHTYTFVAASNQVVQVAPDWNLVVSGTGSIIVERVALTATDTPSQPPYVLDIECLGVNSIKLRQRLFESPRLLAGIYITGFFIAASEDSLPHPLQMQYNPSAGTLDSNVIIDEVITGDGSYNVLQGNLQITGTINPDPATTGYVDIDIIIPAGSHISVSSFQTVGINTPVNLAFDQMSAARQIDYTFHDFKNSMLYMQKQSLFPWLKMGLNPKQFYSSGTIAAQCSYITDGIILYQPAASQIDVTLDTTNLNGALTLAAVAGATDARFALISYLAPQSAQGWWGYWISIMVRALLVSSYASDISIKARIIWRTTLPATIGAAEPISSWPAASDPTFSAGWTAIAPLNDPEYRLSEIEGTDAGIDVYPPYPFDQLGLPLPTPGATNMFGIVLYITSPLNSTLGTEDYVAIDSISPVPNQFAIDGTAFTASQVWEACKFYYYSSYDYGVLAETITTSNQIAIIQDAVAAAGTVEVRPTVITVSYPQMWMDTPTLTFYSPTTGTAGDINIFARGRTVADAPVSGNLDVTLATYWTVATSGDKYSTYTYADVAFPISVTVTGADAAKGATAIATYFFTADSRLGQ